MNELIRKIAVSAAVFCGVVLLMSLAALVMMHAGEKEVPYGGEVRASEGDADTQGKSADTDKKDPAGQDAAVNDPAKSDPKDTEGSQSSDGKSEGNTAEGNKGGDDKNTGTPDDGKQGNESGDQGQNSPGGDSEQGKGGNTDKSEGNGHIIVIDAAHQASNMNEKEPIGPGSDKTKVKVSSGAEGVSTGTPEYKLTLAVAQLLRDELTKRGYDTIMVRESNDVSISDAERAQLANNRGDIIIHIHGNADENSGINGIMAFYPSSSTGFVSKELSGKCKDLCKAILDEMAASTGAKNWGAIEHESLTALNWTKIPAAHVEIGYLSNAEEDKLLQTADYRAKIVQGIADGIDKYFGE